MHGQKMIHGDLKGVRVLMLVSILPSDVPHQGQYPNRQKLPRTPSGLWASYNHLGSKDFYGIELDRYMWYDTMDESRTPRSNQI